MKGYFKDERFFVRRVRDNKDGYLVFAPFITATEGLEMDDRSTINPNAEFGLFVNLGWVPLENKNDITMGNDPVPLLVHSNYYNNNKLLIFLTNANFHFLNRIHAVNQINSSTTRIQV